MERILWKSTSWWKLWKLSSQPFDPDLIAGERGGTNLAIKSSHHSLANHILHKTPSINPLSRSASTRNAAVILRFHLDRETSPPPGPTPELRQVRAPLLHDPCIHSAATTFIRFAFFPFQSFVSV